MKALLDSTIWDLPTQANMALIWMTRKGSWVQVPHGPPLKAQLNWAVVVSVRRSPGHSLSRSVLQTVHRGQRAPSLC